MFDKYKYKGKYYQIVVDGTGIVSFKKRHCKHCLKKVYNRGTENQYEEYYHYVLEAKLVVGDLVISIDTEFVENEKEEVDKQDCELKAFYRMSKRIKKEFPKLPIILTGDSLYACVPVMQVCKDNKWEYILRVKEKRMKDLTKEIKGLEKSEQTRSIQYWNALKYGEIHNENVINVLKYIEYKKEKKLEFVWIVSLEITQKKTKELIKLGRKRWKIENEGFNEQKNGTFNIKHIYCREYNAMKAHYFLIQFAHTIRQLLEKGMGIIEELKMNKKEVSDAITQTLTHTQINLTELKKIQLRFNTS